MPIEFEILDTIGEGDDTLVQKAIDRKGEKRFAVQSLQQKWTEVEPPRRTEFLRAGKLQKPLHSKHLVDVIDVLEAEGQIVREYMAGSVREELRIGPLPADRVRTIVRETLRGLDYLHQRNVIHGRIRPSNLLCDEVGGVKISDCAFLQNNAELALRGSSRYLAPELIAPKGSNPISPATDLYCLGFTALELLLGDKIKTHFKGVDAPGENGENAWLRWHGSSENFPPARTLVPHLPADLAAALDWMLAKQIAQRAPSAAAVLEKLESDRREEPRFSPVPPMDREPPAGMPVDPRVWIAVAAVAVIGVVILLAWPAASPPAEPVTVNLASDPPGSTVSIDSDPKLQCKTPAAVKLMPGKHLLTFTLDFHESLQQELLVQAGEKEVARAVSLRRSFDLVVFVHCSTPQAQLLVNDERARPFTETKEDGRHAAFGLSKTDPWPKLVVRADGFEPHSVDLRGQLIEEKSNGHRVDVTVTLEKAQ